MLPCCINACPLPVLNRIANNVLTDIRNRLTSRRLLAIALLLAQLWAMLVVPMHGIAHASESGVSAAAVANPPGADSPLDLFGHAAGSGCSDWNAAFFVDANPATAPVATAIAESGCSKLADFSTRLVHSGKPGFFLARAPPRA